MTTNGRLSLVILGCVIAGCRTPAKPCRVTGSVTVDGVPAKGVILQFHPISSAKDHVDGTLTEDKGTFSLPVRKSGEYAVTARWPVITLVQGEELEGEDRFSGRHADRANPVLRVTLQEGENQLPPIVLRVK